MKTLHTLVFVLLVDIHYCNTLLQNKALCGACKMNCSIDVIKGLINNGANPNYVDPNDLVSY